MELSKNNRRRVEEPRHTKLQDFVRKYCQRRLLLSHSRTQQPQQERTATAGNDDVAAVLAKVDCRSWTWEDTQTIIQSNTIQFDNYLGLQWYHSNPIRWIHKACAEAGKVFLDHEFCVHEERTISLGIATRFHDKEHRLRPGIISRENYEDLLSTGQPKRIKHAKYYIDRASIIPDPTTRPQGWYWKRVSEISNLGHLFASDDSSVQAKNVIQGQIGNCGFCSAFASLAAQFPDVLRGLFGDVNHLSFSATSEQSPVAGKLSSSGALSVRLYPHGRERYLLLDDYVLCTCIRTSRFTSQFASPSLNSLRNNDFWIRLLEKAFVKVQGGSYASLCGYYKFNSLYRHPARVLQLITGAPLALQLSYDSQKQSVADIYEALLSTEGCCARVAHGRKEWEGVRSGHGYSLLWIGSVANIRLVCLRNPHGKGSYKGPFGRGPNSWSTPQAVKVAKELRASNNPSMEYLQGLLDFENGDDNGTFLMPFEVFVQCFPVLTVVGPITMIKNDSPSPLPQYLASDCVFVLPGEHLYRLPSMIEAARHKS